MKILVLLLLLMQLCGLILTQPEEHTIYFDVYDDSPYFTTDDNYLGFNIDSSIISDWDAVSSLFYTDRFRTLVAAVSPGWVRLGGTKCDYSMFKPDSDIRSDAKYNKKRVNDMEYGMDLVTSLFFLTNDYNYNLTFCLNSLLRTASGIWDPSNAGELMAQLEKYSQMGGLNYTINWELGNEPDLYVQQGQYVNSSQLANDYKAIRALMDRFPMTSKKSYLFGPDVASPLLENFLLDFLKNLPLTNIINAVTYHHYYDLPNNANPAYSYDPKILDKFFDRAYHVSVLVSNYYSTAPIYLTSIADYSDGGVHGISDTFLSGFTFLDSLGIGALMKTSVMLKQSLFGTKYSSMIKINTDTKAVDPLPVYWLALLYKRLVGSTVLYSNQPLNRAAYARVYTHCLNDTNSNGSIVVYFLNCDKNDWTVKLTYATDDMKKSPRLEYLFSTNTTEMQSENIFLNGKLLQMENNHTLPEMKPSYQVPSEEFTLPARQYGFIVFPDANKKSCKKAKNYG